MWPFTTKKPLREWNFYNGLVDWHSHILPGVDDGVPEIEESLKILSDYRSMGVKEVWLTPHIMEDVPNAVDDLRQRFEQFKQQWNCDDLQLHLGAENMLDNLFDQRLEKRELLPIGLQLDHLLVETSYFNPPFDLMDKFSHIMAAGYNPVLAHPERYIYMEEDMYERLHEMGIKFQLNIYSLLGMYGKESVRKANMLLNKGYYTIYGSDTHKHLQMRYARKYPKISKSTLHKILDIPNVV